MRVAMLVAVSAVVALAGPGVKADQNARGLITVEGQSEVRVKPDKVVVTLSAEKRAVSLVQAKAPVEAATTVILDLAHQQGVEARDIDASDYDLEALYDTFDSDAKKRLKRRGFRVSRTIVVTLRDLEVLGPFLSGVVESGLVSVKSVAPGVEDTRPHRDEARLMAVRAAREKAQAIVDALGQELGPAVTIEVDGARTPCCEGEGWSATRVFSSNSAMMRLPNRSGDYLGGASVSLAPIVLTASVKVAFELK